MVTMNETVTMNKMVIAIDANLHQLLRREIDAALLDRDRTIKEAHELREKLGIIIS